MQTAHIRSSDETGKQHICGHSHHNCSSRQRCSVIIARGNQLFSATYFSVHNTNGFIGIDEYNTSRFDCIRWQLKIDLIFKKKRQSNLQLHPNNLYNNNDTYSDVHANNHYRIMQFGWCAVPQATHVTTSHNFIDSNANSTRRRDMDACKNTSILQFICAENLF